MGRIALVAALFAITFAACTSAEPPNDEASSVDPPRVPNPPPKYKHIDFDASFPNLDGGGELQIKCSGPKPFVCPLENGTFVCSEYPCVPDCSKVGCIGGDTCLPCDGGYRCISPGSTC